MSSGPNNAGRGSGPGPPSARNGGGRITARASAEETAEEEAAMDLFWGDGSDDLVPNAASGAPGNDDDGASWTDEEDDSGENDNNGSNNDDMDDDDLDNSDGLDDDGVSGLSVSGMDTLASSGMLANSLGGSNDSGASNSSGSDGGGGVGVGLQAVGGTANLQQLLGRGMSSLSSTSGSNSGSNGGSGTSGGSSNSGTSSTSAGDAGAGGPGPASAALLRQQQQLLRQTASDGGVGGGQGTAAQQRHPGQYSDAIDMQDPLNSFLATLQADTGADNTSSNLLANNFLGGFSTSTASMKDLLAAWSGGNSGTGGGGSGGNGGTTRGGGGAGGMASGSATNSNSMAFLPALSQDDLVVALQQQQLQMDGGGNGGGEEEAMVLPAPAPTMPTAMAMVPGLPPMPAMPGGVTAAASFEQMMAAMANNAQGSSQQQQPATAQPTTATTKASAAPNNKTTNKKATDTDPPPKRAAKRRHPGRPPTSTQAAATAVAKEAAAIMAKVAAEQSEQVAQAQLDQDKVTNGTNGTARSTKQAGRPGSLGPAAARQISRQQLLHLQKQQQAQQQQQGTPIPSQYAAPFPQARQQQMPNPQQQQAAFAAAAAAAAAVAASGGNGGVPMAAPFLAQMATNPGAFLQMMMMQQQMQAQQMQSQQQQQQQAKIQEADRAQAQQIQAHMLHHQQPTRGPVVPIPSPPPLPTGAAQTPAMAAAAAAAMAEAAIEAKDRRSRAVAPPNVVSCSDTDGLTTDAESGKHGKKRVIPRGSQLPKHKKQAIAAMNMADHLSASSSTPVASGSAMASTLPGSKPGDGLTAQEVRAKAARARNREHARNTRLRKKQYQEKLKATVEDLCRERDILISERAGTANLLVEMHNTRTDVLLSFFALRSANERRRELWSSILDESCFSCLLPVTPYRSFPASEVQGGCQRTVLGIDGVMSDTASLHVLLNSLVDRSRFPNAKVRFQYTLVTEDAVVAGNQMMARWVMTTLNAKECGAKMEVSKRGMLSCKFNSAHKLTSLEMMFDVMAFMLQLKQAAGTDSFAVVPNTVQTCQRSFGLPMVMTIADRPHTIIQVNKLWEDMTGFKAEDVVGRTSCRVLQGKETETANLDLLMSDVNHKRPTNIALTNYTKSGKRFQNHINVFPLSTDSKITHYIALTTYCGLIDGRGSHAAAPAPISIEQEDGKATEKKNPGVTNEKPAKSAMKKDAESIKTHQAVAPARQSSSLSSSSQQASGKSGNQSKPKVVVAGTTNRQDSSESNGGGDTISSLTSSLSSSNSDDGSNSNAISSSSASAPDAQKQQQPVPTTTSTDTAAEVVSRKTVTTGSSMSSSASGSTSTNGSSSDEAKTETEEKTKRKRTVDATPAGDNVKKRRVTRRG